MIRLFKILFIICLSIVQETIVTAQKQPIDTTFYSDGSINFIRYKDCTTRYFKKSLNPLDRNKPVTDTIFNYYKDNNRLDWYSGATRIFTYDKSNVYIERYNKYGSRKDSAFYKINGIYSFLFKELNDLEITIGYRNDTSISSLIIGIYDTLSKRPDDTKETFAILYFNNAGAYFYTDTTNGFLTSSIFNCGKYGELILFFNKNNLLHKVLFQKDTTNNYYDYYEFYNNFYCKKHGYIKGIFETDEWYEYHPNGNISSIGKYRFKNNYLSVKDGLWKYFNLEGKLIKDELYDKGLLTKTNNY